MDPDGRNQRQITHFNSLTIEPAVSPDGTKIAFTSYAKGNSCIFVFSVDPVRDLRFYNQVASMNCQPSFTPDGKQIVYSSSAGRCCRIFIANLDGSGFQPITSSGSIDAEPKVNPKTGADDRVFVGPFRAGADLPHEHRRSRYRAADRRDGRGVQSVLESGRAASSRLPGRAAMRRANSTYSSWTWRSGSTCS